MKNTAERVRDILPVIKPKRNKLPKEIYAALEGIVGHGNITEDEGVIDGYHNYTTGQVLGVGTVIALPAVVLPASTEEVAAMPEAKARPRVPPSSWAMVCSSASRVGLSLRA